MFYRNDERDDYWHMGAGTLIKSGQPDDGVISGSKELFRQRIFAIQRIVKRIVLIGR